MFSFLWRCRTKRLEPHFLGSPDTDFEVLARDRLWATSTHIIIYHLSVNIHNAQSSFVGSFRAVADVKLGN